MHEETYIGKQRVNCSMSSWTEGPCYPMLRTKVEYVALCSLDKSAGCQNKVPRPPALILRLRSTYTHDGRDASWSCVIYSDAIPQVLQTPLGSRLAACQPQSASENGLDCLATGSQLWRREFELQDCVGTLEQMGLWSQRRRPLRAPTSDSVTRVTLLAGRCRDVSYPSFVCT